MPGVDKHTTHYESCGCAEAKVERLEEKNKGLRKDNLELVNRLEGEGYRLERLEARIAELEAALIPAIRLCHQAKKSLLAHRSDSFRDCDSPVCRNATRALKGGDA